MEVKIINFFKKIKKFSLNKILKKGEEIEVIADKKGVTECKFKMSHPETHTGDKDKDNQGALKDITTDNRMDKEDKIDLRIGVIEETITTEKLIIKTKIIIMKAKENKITLI